MTTIREESVGELVKAVAEGRFVIPHFQRGYVEGLDASKSRFPWRYARGYRVPGGVVLYPGRQP